MYVRGPRESTHPTAGVDPTTNSDGSSTTTAGVDQGINRQQ